MSKGALGKAGTMGGVGGGCGNTSGTSPRSFWLRTTLFGSSFDLAFGVNTKSCVGPLFGAASHANARRSHLQRLPGMVEFFLLEKASLWEKKVRAARNL